MEPTSRGFAEVRDVFFKELVELSKNSLNGGGKENMGDVSHVSLSTNLLFCASLLKQCKNNAFFNVIFHFFASI